MKNCASTLALMLLLATSLAASTIEIEFGKVQARVISGSDPDGDLEISIMLPIENKSDTSIYIDLEGQALDRDGFEVFEFMLDGTIKALSEGILTDTDFIDEELYYTIDSWRVQSVDMEVALAP